MDFGKSSKKILIMKTRLFLLTLLLSAFSSFAQRTGDLVIFSNTGEQFYVVLNGVRQNMSPETNVKVEGLKDRWYSCKIISSTQTFEIEKNVGIKMDSLTTYRITEKKGKYKLRFYSERPSDNTLEPNQTVVTYHAAEQNTNTGTANNTGTINNTGINTTTNTTTTTTTTGTNNGSNSQSTSFGIGVKANSTGNENNNDQNTESINININIDENMGGMNNGGNVQINENNSTSTTTTTTSTSSSSTVNGETTSSSTYEETNSTTVNGQTTTSTYSESSTTTTNGGTTETTTNVNWTGNDPGTTTTTTTTGMNTDVNWTGNEAGTTTTTTGMNADFSNTEVSPNTSACFYEMDATNFASAKKSISSKSFADSKMTVAKQIADNNCLSAQQIKEIANLFDFEDDKLVFAKYAYNRCVDQNNYFKVNEAFQFDSSVDELNDFINGTTNR